MREFEFSSDEAVLANDDTVRRLFARVAPSVRKDIIGWMGLGRIAALFGTTDEAASDDVLRDYIVGSSLALDLLPNRSYEFYTSDAEAVGADLQSAGVDMRLMAELVNQLGRAACDGQSRPPVKKEPASE